MMDKITAKIRRYPFQTGIIIGVIACLLLAGFISLFQDHGRTLAGNSEIIQEDYLRMSINEYSQNHNEALALWRYDHLGNKADTTLKYMIADETISPISLSEFADAIGKADKLGGIQRQRQSQSPEGTPTNPRKGLSGVGKVLLIIVGVVVAAAGGLYAASLIQTKNKQKRRSEKAQNFEEEPINMITPDKARSIQENTSETLFDLDSLFPQNAEENNSGKGSETSEKETETEVYTQEKLLDKDETEKNIIVESEKYDNDDESSVNEGTKDAPLADDGIQEQVLNSYDKTEIENEVSTEEDAPKIHENNEINDKNVDDELTQHDNMMEETTDENLYPGLEYETSSHSFIEESETEVIEKTDEDKAVNKDDTTSTENVDIIAVPEQEQDKTDESSESSFEMDNSAEKPLVETDSENEVDNVDELLKMIRAGNVSSDTKDQKIVENEAEISEADIESPEEINNTENINDNNGTPETYISDDEEREQSNDDVLIHYQSQYRIGNDMYDEVFSIDQGDIFRGECGIGIGETLNNTEPKAVTAFEVWLFDKDDIHTATWYLMSDFALANDGISQRLAQRGKCDRIRKGDLYTLETETLIVEIKILELEYGNEMEEKNSYFTNVVFDVIARHKNAE